MNESNIELANAATARFNAGYPSLGGRVHVPCQLFKAGPYPDKGITVTEADIDALIQRFNSSERQVPIRVEHIETPLDPLGHVVALHREGEFLFGTLAFPVGLYAHIQERKADRVSVGLHRIEDSLGAGYLLHECSLVFTPRVAGAGFLSPEQIAARLSAQRQAGKITPAMEGPLTRLYGLSTDSTVGIVFSEGVGAEISAAIDALLNAMPVVQNRGAAVPVHFHQSSPNSGPTLSPEMEQWARSMGLDPARVAKLK